VGGLASAHARWALRAHKAKLAGRSRGRRRRIYLRLSRVVGARLRSATRRTRITGARELQRGDPFSAADNGSSAASGSKRRFIVIVFAVGHSSRIVLPGRARCDGLQGRHGAGTPGYLSPRDIPLAGAGLLVCEPAAGDRLTFAVCAAAKAKRAGAARISRTLLHPLLPGGCALVNAVLAL